MASERGLEAGQLPSRGAAAPGRRAPAAASISVDRRRGAQRSSCVRGRAARTTRDRQRPVSSCQMSLPGSSSSTARMCSGLPLVCVAQPGRGVAGHVDAERRASARTCWSSSGGHGRTRPRPASRHPSGSVSRRDAAHRQRGAAPGCSSAGATRTAARAATPRRPGARRRRRRRSATSSARSARAAPARRRRGWPAEQRVRGAAAPSAAADRRARTAARSRSRRRSARSTRASIELRRGSARSAPSCRCRPHPRRAAGASGRTPRRRTRRAARRVRARG